MRKSLIFISVLLLSVTISNVIFAQGHPSEEVLDNELYGSHTKWSCMDKHFGYFFIDYSLPIPIEKGITNEFASHSLKIGYTYRYKIIDAVDLGLDLSYVNRTSKINSDSLGVFDPSDFYSKIKTYQNGFGASPYIRINLSGADYRNLGYFIDLGGYYNYNVWYGVNYMLDDNDLKQKARFKQSDFLSQYDYGLFARFALNNIAFTASYSLSDWIEGFSNQDLSFSRSPLLIGVQMNLYTK